MPFFYSSATEQKDCMAKKPICTYTAVCSSHCMTMSDTMECLNRFLQELPLCWLRWCSKYNWRLHSIPDLRLPKSYIRSNLCDWSLAWLQIKLYPNFRSEDIELTLTFRKYTSVVYKGMKFSGTSKSVVYVTKPLYDLQQDSAASGSVHVHTHDRKPHPVLLRYFVLENMYDKN